MRLTYATERSSVSASASCVRPRSCLSARTFSPSFLSTSRRGSRCTLLLAILLEVLVMDDTVGEPSRVLGPSRPAVCASQPTDGFATQREKRERPHPPRSVL